MSTTLEILTDALQDIPIVGLNDSEAHAEDIAKALRLFNRRGLNWNTRKSFAKFERMQTFPVLTTKESYTIGPPGKDSDGTLDPLLDPDFLVASGNMPMKIHWANWVLGTGPTRMIWPIEVITVQDYRELYMPGFTGVWPYGMYYQKTPPAGTLFPWPVPTDLVDGLQLFWWDQFTAVDIGDIALELNWPDGYELAFALTLAEDLCLPFEKERPQQLKEAAGAARADFANSVRTIPRLDTSGCVADSTVLRYTQWR